MDSSKKIKKPNLFIVGARKTGTTSLYEYLKKHPEVYMSEVKEPHFFSQNLDYHIHLYKTEKEYLELFKESKNRKIVGEASTSYLDDPETAKRIAKLCPDSKIIIILRDLVDLIYLGHYEFAFRGRVEEDFKIELEKQEKNESIVNYLDLIQSLPKSIEAYLKEFGEENVYILNYEKFDEDTEKEFCEILKFLEIDNSFKTEFKRYNQVSKAKSKLLTKLLNSKTIHNIGKIVYSLLPFTRQFDPFNFNKESFVRPELDSNLKNVLENKLTSVYKSLEKYL